MLKPLARKLDKANQPDKYNKTKVPNALKKHLKDVSAVAFLAAAYPKGDETILG